MCTELLQLVINSIQIHYKQFGFLREFLFFNLSESSCIENIRSICVRLKLRNEVFIIKSKLKAKNKIDMHLFDGLGNEKRKEKTKFDVCICILTVHSIHGSLNKL
jgi:hypothetical protein